MARKSWTDKTPAPVKKAVDTVKSAASSVARAVTSKVPHKCDPTGFACDCARRAEINASTDTTKRNWIPKRKGWLK